MSIPIDLYKAIPCDLFYSKPTITPPQDIKEQIKIEKPKQTKRDATKKVVIKKAPKSKKNFQRKMKATKELMKSIEETPLIEESEHQIELDMNANEIPAAMKKIKKIPKNFKIFLSKNTDDEMFDSESELEKSIQDYKDNFEAPTVEKFQRKNNELPAINSNDSFGHGEKKLIKA